MFEFFNQFIRPFVVSNKLVLADSPQELKNNVATARNIIITGGITNVKQWLEVCLEDHKWNEFTTEMQKSLENKARKKDDPDTIVACLHDFRRKTLDFTVESLKQPASTAFPMHNPYFIHMTSNSHRSKPVE